MPGVVIVGQGPSIPQSAFADTSLCTREVRWPDGHTVFALARCACLGKESMTAQALGLSGAGAQYGSGGSPPPPRGRKRAGENLVFPREPAAALPTGMMVISALCRNNTPPMLQEGPGGLRRDEAWSSLRRSEGSGS
ncbi:hypothetical protein DW741_03075 [Ruminococcaceae bacterium AM28-23LB]|nr:hypothetical protein DW741_03075 [Ruminococcaceae bacterium AM28-23LB]